jgi:hypothetical protein
MDRQHDVTTRRRSTIKAEADPPSQMAIWCPGMAGRSERGSSSNESSGIHRHRRYTAAQRRSCIIWALALAALIVTLAMAAA